VQITDNLSAIFGAPATYSVANISATGVTANGGFDGGTDTNLLMGNDTLAVGATATVSFQLTFQPNGVTGPFNNSAEATANPRRVAIRNGVND